MMGNFNLLEYIKTFNNILKKNKIIIRIIILFFFIILLIIGKITIYKIYKLLIILLIAIIYTRLLLLIEYILINILLNMQVNAYNFKILSKILKLLLKINGLKNPLWLIIPKAEVKIFDILYKLNNVFIKNKIMRQLFYIIFLNVLLNPIKLFYWKYYKMVWNWKNSTIVELLFIRLYGLVLSILIFTDIINLILYYAGIYIYIYIYLFFFILSLLSDNEKFADFFNLAKGTGFILYKRNEVTILGVIILEIVDHLKTLYWNLDNQLFLNFYESSFYNLVWLFWGWRSLFDKSKFKQWLQITKMENLCYINEKLYLAESKDRPSFNFYSFLIANKNTSVHIDSLLNIEYFKIKGWEYIKKNANFIDNDIYEIEHWRNIQLAMFKAWLFLIWDIDDYIGYKGFDNLIVEYIYDSYSIIYKDITNTICNDYIIDDKMPNNFWDLNSNSKFYENFFNHITIFPGKKFKDYDLIYENYNKKYGTELYLMWSSEIDDTEILEWYKKIKSDLILEWHTSCLFTLEERNWKRLNEINHLIEKELKRLNFYKS